MKRIFVTGVALLLLAACIDPAQRKADKYMTSLDSMSARSDSVSKMGRDSMNAADTAMMRDTAHLKGDSTH